MILFDEIKRLWNLYTRQWVTPGANDGPDNTSDPHTYRAVRRLVSVTQHFPTNLTGWIAENATFASKMGEPRKASYIDQAVVMARDRIDEANYEEMHHPAHLQPPVDYYQATVFVPDGVHNLHLMFPERHWHFLPSCGHPHMVGHWGMRYGTCHPATKEPGLAVSRTGGRSPSLGFGPSEIVSGAHEYSLYKFTTVVCKNSFLAHITSLGRTESRA